MDKEEFVELKEISDKNASKTGVINERIKVSRLKELTDLLIKDSNKDFNREKFRENLDKLKFQLDGMSSSMLIADVWLNGSFLYERLMKVHFNEDYFSDKYVEEFAPDPLKQKLNKDLIKLLTNKAIKYNNTSGKDKIISIDAFCQLFKLEKHELSGKYIYLGKIILIFDFGYNSVTIKVNKF